MIKRQDVVIVISDLAASSHSQDSISTVFTTVRALQSLSATNNLQFYYALLNDRFLYSENSIFYHSLMVFCDRRIVLVHIFFL